MEQFGTRSPHFLGDLDTPAWLTCQTLQGSDGSRLETCVTSYEEAKNTN